MTHTIAVLPALVTFQALQLENGRTITVALETPQQKFAVVHRDGDDLDVLALRDDQVDAIAYAASIIGQLEVANRDARVLQ